MLVRVVEDDLVIAELLRMALEHDGLDVAVTSTDFTILLGPTLWAGVEVAVIDLQLNDKFINGVDILRYLKEHFPHVRRIVLSAVSDIPSVIRELGDVADRVLSKPQGINQIIEAVRG